MITGINESKILTEDISCEIKCRFDGKNVIQINGGVTINVDVSVKNVMCQKRLATYSCENAIYLASIMNDSAITCDGIIESNNLKTKAISKIFNEKKTKMQNAKCLYSTCIFINYYSIIDSY